MKKNLLFISAALLVAGTLTACGNTNKTSDVKFGVGYVTSYNEKKNQFEATVVAAAFDKNGKVIDARTDVTQVAFQAAANADATGYTVSVVTGSGDKSKLELGTDYGMVAIGGAAHEAYEQLESWSDWTVGKTAAEVASSKDEISGVSISTVSFTTALQEAYTKSYTVAAPKGLKVGVGMVNGGVSGKGEGSLYYAGALTDGKKVVTTYVDCLAYTLTAADADTITLVTNKYTTNAAEGQVIKSKRDLKELYAMKKDNPTCTAEYFEQCEALDKAVAGKTLEEVAAIVDGDKLTGVTVTPNGLNAVVKEAVAYSVKDVVTDKPVAAK